MMAGKDRAISLHNQLLYTTIAIDYLHQNVDSGLPAERFYANCREFFHDPVTCKDKDVKSLLEQLERKGLVDVGDYDILKYIVKFDARLVKKICRLENDMQQHYGVVVKRRTIHADTGIYLILSNTLCIFPFLTTCYATQY